MAFRNSHILIAGAGIGGLALAIMLECAGIDYTIFEKATCLKPLGSTIILSPQVLRVFEQLGIYEELLKVGIPVVDARYYKQSQKRFGRVDQRVYASSGSILVGADGAYSAVRQSLYRSMADKNVSIPASDTDPLRFESFCLVGLTEDMSAEFPELNETKAVMHTVVASKTKAYNVNIVPLGHGKVGWSIMGKYLSPQVHDQKNFHLCDWEGEVTDYLRKDVEEIAVPVGGTLGNVIQNTKDISFVMLEGANQAILDAIVLANLIQELPAPATPADITRAFDKYYELRATSSKNTVVSSRQLSDIMSKESFDEVSSWRYTEYAGMGAQ
ncbi:hypothetical protein BGZ73_007018 [Actinomortierella ambigua]|nr:hypothetical protein BGZ73_007018 [Actinomortierella ambigua]